MTETQRQVSQAAFGLPAEAAKTLHHLTGRPLAKAVQQQVVQDNLRSSSRAYHAWLQQGSREDISASTANIRVPCFVLAGDQDLVLPPAVHRAYTQPLLPAGTPLELLAGAGHLLPYEAPTQVAARLRAFARQL